MSNLTQNQKKIFIVVVIIVIGIVGYYIYGRDKTYNEIEDSEMLVNNVQSEENDTDTEEKIIVHIAGAVKNAGIVELKENSRLSDAVNAAGGLTEDADMSKINLAYVLEDGIKINIPSINDAQEELYTQGEEFVETDVQSSTRK